MGPDPAIENLDTPFLENTLQFAPLPPQGYKQLPAAGKITFNSIQSRLRKRPARARYGEQFTIIRYPSHLGQLQGGNLEP